MSTTSCDRRKTAAIIRAAIDSGCLFSHPQQEEAVNSAKTEISLDLSPAHEVLKSMAPVSSGQIIPLLQKLQGQYGYLPKEVLLDVCERADLPASRVFGVATFYEQFHLEPQGRHLIRCCRGTACHVKGGQRIIQAIERELGIGEGETTDDLRFTFQTVACLGTCFLAPVIMVDDEYYGQVSADQITSILDQYE
jgi:NADH-quinone oxidoreductase subunit E